MNRERELLMRQLREKMAAEGLSQRDVAVAAGISQGSVWNFLNDVTRTPRNDTWKRLIAFVDDIPLPGTEPPTHEGWVPEIACPHCRCTVPGPEQGALHCLQCGRLVGKRCANCNAVNHLGNAKCRICGSELQDAPRTREVLPKMIPVSALY